MSQVEILLKKEADSKLRLFKLAFMRYYRTGCSPSKHQSIAHDFSILNDILVDAKIEGSVKSTQVIADTMTEIMQVVDAENNQLTMDFNLVK